MAKQYIYRDTKVFRATFTDEAHATNVVRNTVAPENRKQITIDRFCKEFGIDMPDFKKIAKTISIEPWLCPEDGYYWLDINQYDDMHTVVKMFLDSNQSLNKDIQSAIKKKKFIQVDCILDVSEKRTKKDKQEETEEYNNRKKFVDSVRRRNKKELNKKFIVGKKYFLRVRSVTNYNHLYKIYELKKFIYSINNRTVNVVVMKRINPLDDETPNTTFTLNRTDCAKYHIKYEPGLQVFPMELNWCPVNENNVKFKEYLANEK